MIFYIFIAIDTQIMSLCVITPYHLVLSLTQENAVDLSMGAVP